MHWTAWNNSGVPSRHAEFGTGRALDDHPAWSERFMTILSWLGTGFTSALIGDRGGGKTQMAVEVVRRRCGELDPAILAGLRLSVDRPRYPGPRYMRMTDLLMRLRATYGRDSNETEIQVIERYTSPTLLVIDEAHERGETAWENRMLPHILDVRYGAKRDTLLISNQSPEAFEAAMGASIYSRLAETGGVVVCDWGSFRDGAGD